MLHSDFKIIRTAIFIYLILFLVFNSHIAETLLLLVGYCMELVGYRDEIEIPDQQKSLADIQIEKGKTDDREKSEKSDSKSESE